MDNRVDLYGLRMTYRFSNNPEVQTKDFEGTNKGERVEAFYQSLKEQGSLNYAAVSVFDPSAEAKLAEASAAKEAS